MLARHRPITRALVAGALALALYGCAGAPDTDPTPTATSVTATPSGDASAPAGVAGPGTTGVPVGTELTPSGPLYLAESGQVVDGLDVTGCVIVAADDVTIRNSRITCADPEAKRVIRSTGGVTGFVIEDSEVDGSRIVDIGVDVSPAVLRRLDVHGVNDGVRLGSEITLEDSWVHALSRIGELHPDAVQGISAQDVVIRGNTLDPRDPVGDDLGNAAIQLGSETGTKLSRNVVIEDNRMDGGNYSLNISGAINAEDIRVSDNLFGTQSRYGPIIAPDDVPIGEGNTMVDTGGEAEVDSP